MAGRSSPPFDDALSPLSDRWDVVMKVKFGDTLKRFNAYVNGPHFSLSLSDLRSKIASAFKFGPGADYILTYTDEDGDIVMLDDDHDLHDAAIHQKLNPLRINVQLKSTSAGASQTKQHVLNSTPPRSTTWEDQVAQLKSDINEALKPETDPVPHALAQLKSAIDQALKAVPEPIPHALAKLSHDLLSRATSSAPPLTELLEPFAKLIAPNTRNDQPFSGPPDSSFGSSSGAPQTSVDLKADEPKAPVGSDSQPLAAQNSESSKARGLKSVLSEDPVLPCAEGPQEQQASGYPSIEELLFSTSSGGNKSNCKGSSNAQNKGKSVIKPSAGSSDGQNKGKSVMPSTGTSDAQNKGKSIMPSAGSSNAQNKGKSVMPSIAPPTPPIVPPVCPAPSNPLMSGWLPPPPRHEPKFYPSNWQSEANGKIGSDPRWRIPLYRAPHAPPSYLPSPCIPYPGRLLPPGHIYGELGNNYESSPSRASHRWIHCDGCGVRPIVGPRYKSNVKEDYDLCGPCFHRMGNESEYTRIDRPIVPSRVSRDPNCRKIHHPRVLMKSRREKLESRFILDVTVLDGTLMVPATPFTKIWRMHNNGSTMWPSGTQLIWVGGDQFALQSSVPLEIPMNGLPVDREIDIAVDFVAPPRPGRFISYWRLASPSGQKFGQRVWVHIQVEHTAINLNLPPECNSTNTEHLIDVNVEPFDPLVGEHVESTQAELLEPLMCHEVVVRPKESEPAPNAVPSVFPAVPAVFDHGIIDLPSSSATTADFVPTVNVPISASTTEPANVPTTTSANFPISAPTTAPVNVPVSALFNGITPEPVSSNSLTEEKLLRELEEMGFRQVDLNKEILRQNNFNLEQSVVDLCGFNEWDPLLAELHEMGFDDAEVNKELLAKNGGSIKRAVMDLVAREKKDK